MVRPLNNEPHTCPADAARTSTPVQNSSSQNTSRANTVMPQQTYNEGRKAYNAGQRVGANLIGYTTDAEQYEVRDIIHNRVDKETVTSFLRGYEDYRTDNRWFGKEAIGGVIPDHFFEQLRSENGFENNHGLMKNVATKLMKNFEMCGAYAQAEMIREILTHEPLTKEDAKSLDKLAQEAIKYAN